MLTVPSSARALNSLLVLQDFPELSPKKKSVDLPDEDPTTFKLLMHFLYEGDYAPILESSVLEDGYHQAMGIRTTPQQAAFPHTCVTSSSHPSPRTIRVRCTEALCYHHTCSVQCNTPSAGLANPAPVACVNFTCPECPLAKDKPSPAVIVPEDLLTHAKMYAIADRLIVGGLKHLVKTKFLVTCHYHWNSPQFSEALEYVFTSTPEKDKGMRFIVCRTIANHITLLKDPKIKEMMMEFNDLAYGVLCEKAKQQKWL